MRFSPKQLSLIKHSTAKINVAEGAIRSGKTVAFGAAWLGYIASLPEGSTVLMSGRTKMALWRNVTEDLTKLLGEGNYSYNKSDGLLTIGGRQVWCVGANDDDAWEKIRGDTFAGWYADEVTLHPESFVKEALGRLSDGPGRVFWSCNPDTPYHPLATEYIFKKKLRQAGLVKVWHFTLEDNPGLQQEYVESLKLLYTGLWYKRLILGQWVAAEGAIYEMIDPTPGGRHVVLTPDLPEHCDRRIICCDYGTATVTVYLDLRYSEGCGWWVHDEWYWDAVKQGRQKTDSELADDLAEFVGDGPEVEALIIDEAATSFIAECGQRDDLPPIMSSEKAVTDGIKHVAGLFGSGTLRIAARCRQLLAEITGYVWDSKAQKKGEDKPLKRADHGPDALRYGLYTVHIRKPATFDGLRQFKGQGRRM